MCLSALGLCESADVGRGGRDGESICMTGRKQEKEFERERASEGERERARECEGERARSRARRASESERGGGGEREGQKLTFVFCTEWAPKPGVHCCSVLQRVAECCSVSCTQWANPGVRCCSVLQLAACVSCTECARAWGMMLKWSV